ncbi:hypothetical protein Tco_0287324 [Tanacetum coccineum]
MANLSEDIQCAGPIPDHLYLIGLTLHHGPFQMGTYRETLAEGNEGALHLGPERARVYSDLSLEDKDRSSKADKVLQLQWDWPHSKELHLAQGPYNSEYFKDKMLLMQAQENKVALDEEQLLFLAGGQDNVVDEDVNEQPVQDLALTMDNVFQTDDCDAFDSDVDEAPTAQTMFMANLSSADPVYDEASPSYDSDILSEVPDHDNYHDAVCEHHDIHEIHDDVQPNYVVNSHADYMSDSNMIPYDQHVKDNVVPVVQSNVSSIPNDAYMMILNEMHEQATQCVSTNEHNKVVNASLTVELARYK